MGLPIFSVHFMSQAILKLSVSRVSWSRDGSVLISRVLAIREDLSWPDRVGHKDHMLESGQGDLHATIMELLIALS